MSDLLKMDEVSLSLFEPRSQMNLGGAALSRALVFKATLLKGETGLPVDAFGKVIGGEVHLVETDQPGQRGSVAWTEVRNRDRDNPTGLGQRCVNLKVTVPLVKAAIEYADTFHARKQRLVLTLQIIPLHEPVALDGVKRLSDPLRIGPWPVEVSALAFEPYRL
jgi:hypothetical protein